MKKIYLALFVLLTLATASNAQRENFCLSSEMNNQSLQNNPQLQMDRQALEQWTQRYGLIERSSRTNGVVYVIPIVFHILHEYGGENISDAQIFDEVAILNRDYRKLNADTADVVPDFKPIIADAEIEFRLPSIDPQGNCTNGIDRIVTPLTAGANDASKLNPWPYSRYLNIWIARTLENTGAAAYAYYPGSAPDTTKDGVLCRYDYVGSIGTSSVNNSRTITHEIGHCLNLAHPWGSTNSPGVACGDDNVSDTPITQGWTSCVLNGSVCNPPFLENVQNYMDYSYCDVMFTEGQKTRMRAALNSNIGRRINLWSTANLLSTGVTQGPQLCTPIADFGNDHSLICTNGTVNYYDLSWKGRVSSWNWTFPGGTPATSTDSTLIVTYATPGDFAATLVVTNATGTDSITRTLLVHVSNTTTTSIPYSESFETVSSFPGVEGIIVNDDNGITWARVTNAASAGVASIKINNYSNTTGQVDEWIMPTFDLSNVTAPVVMTFKVANAQRNTTSTDQLLMSGSFNCGTNWQPRYTKSGATLATAGVISTNFTPTSAQWRTETVSLNAYKLLPNIRFKFTNTSNRGNNTYIDEINLTGTIVNVNEVDDIQLGFAIYPNPTSEASSVQFQLSSSEKIIIDVKDILGKTISNVLNEELNAGQHEVKLPLLPRGIYMIDLYSGNKHHVRKLIVS